MYYGLEGGAKRRSNEPLTYLLTYLSTFLSVSSHLLLGESELHLIDFIGATCFAYSVIADFSERTRA